jgi:phosphotriesterase-related protein
MGERSGKVQTVQGLVEPGVLGHVQPHEHLLVNLLPPPFCDAPGEPIRLETLGRLRRHWTSNPENLRLDSIDDAIEEMRRYRAAGGGTLVEATCSDIGRDPKALQQISRETGVHIVMGSGYYEAVYHPPELESLAEEAIAERVERDLLEGVDGSGVRSGIIGEIGLGHPIKSGEEKVLRAAVAAQRETGAAVLIHPPRDPNGPREALRIVSEAGGDLDRVIMSHIDRTLFDLAPMRELAASGCYLEFDLFGQESSFYPIAPIDMPNDATRISYLHALIEAGFGDRLLVSQDICTKIHLTRYGGEGYTHILENVIPMMDRAGIGKEEIRLLCVENPARVLAIA